MKKFALMAFLVLGAGLMTSRAEVRFSVNLGPVFCQPPLRQCERRVAYCPPPVVCYPQPVYYEEPEVAVCRPRRVVIVGDDSYEGYREERRVVYRHRPVYFAPQGYRAGYDERRVVYTRPGW